MRKILLLTMSISLLVGCTPSTPQAMPGRSASEPTERHRSSNTPAPTSTLKPIVVEVSEETASFLRENLARGKWVTASSHQNGHGPELSVDGRIGYSSAWVSSGAVPQWIEIDLQQSVNVELIELIISQPRTEITHHQIWGRSSDGEYQLLHEFQQETSIDQVLTVTPTSMWNELQAIKIVTLSSPSLVAWQEIQVFGEVHVEPSGIASSQMDRTIFFNGVVITMDDAMGIQEAVAIQGDRILAVGSSEDILSLEDEITTLIDLQGNTIMPGFVDAHNHALTQPEGIGESFTIQDRLLREGITTTTEMGVHQAEIETIQQLDANHQLHLRVSLYMLFTSNCGELMGDWYLDHPPQLSASSRVHIVGLKAFADGGSCRVPAVSVGYASGIGKGDLFFTQEEMNRFVAQAQSDGYQFAVHALGDRAVEQVLNAFIEVLDGRPNDLRHRVEHNAVVRPELFSLYSLARPVATLFGNAPTCFWKGDPSKFKYALPQEIAHWEWPYGDLMNANPEVIFAWHSDVPVFPLSTSASLFGFVTRAQVSPDGIVCEPYDWMREQAIPVETALEMMTINAAYAINREDQIGSITPGKFADLIILSENPLEMDPYSLVDLEVWMTMVGGDVEYCAPQRDPFCP